MANAHLDPVWLWDWREGLNEGITTVRTILDLMDEDPKLTFIRGESIIYKHIQAEDPKTFDRIKKYVKEGRWDVVGGTYIQPDTNLPGTETLARHFAVAQNYFQKTFGRAPRVAWEADSFGHSAGFPEILAASGITGFAFTRPEPEFFTLPHPAFWWESASGARVLAYRPKLGWYGTNRDEIFRRLDAYLEANEEDNAQNIGCFYGVGNHGGGPTRRQLDDIRRWADKNPEVEVVHSGLHRFFDALAAEEKERPGGYPAHRGELNFCLRGCYASMAKFKFPYRRTEATLISAEKTDSVIRAFLKQPPQDLKPAWESVLFNSFHDILPGSSIERAYTDQLAWLGEAYHQAQTVQFNALNALATQVNTSVPKPPVDHPSLVPILVWNPHPHEYNGPVELEASLDYRPLFAYENRDDKVPVEVRGPGGVAIPFQLIAAEHSLQPSLPWRKRVVFQAKLPAMSWSVYQMGLGTKLKKAPRVASPTSANKPGTIRNGFYRIAVKKGASALQIYYKNKAIFAGTGFSILNFEDPWGSWGGKTDNKDSMHLAKVQEKWKITDLHLLESGPERSSIWVRFAGKKSWLALTFTLARQRPVVDVQARLLWNERGSRLKMIFPVGDQAEFEVPGAVVKRGPSGEVPGGRWVRVKAGKGGSGSGLPFGFASDALYAFACARGALHATIARASRYAYSSLGREADQPWRPAADAGELNFRFLITQDVNSLVKYSQELEEPLVTQLVPPHRGALAPKGSLFSLKQSNVQVLAIKPAEKGSGWIVRVQELAGKTTVLEGRWIDQDLRFGLIKPWSISIFHIGFSEGKWKVQLTDIQERNRKAIQEKAS